MTRQVLAAVASLLLTVFYLAVVALLSVQAHGAVTGTSYSLIDNELTGQQTPHLAWYYILAAAIATALMFFLASSKHVLLLVGVRRTFNVTMLVVLLAAVVAGVLTWEAAPEAGISPGLDGWVQDWGTNLAVYTLIALLLLQLIRDRGGVETLPPYDEQEDVDVTLLD